MNIPSLTVNIYNLIYNFCGLIIICNSGVIYKITCWGTACREEEIEGIFIPINKDETIRDLIKKSVNNTINKKDYIFPYWFTLDENKFSYEACVYGTISKNNDIINWDSNHENLKCAIVWDNSD